MSDLNVLDIEVSIENIADAKEIEAVVNSGIELIEDTTNASTGRINELGGQYVDEMKQIRSTIPSDYTELSNEVSSLSETIVDQRELGYLSGNLIDLSNIKYGKWCSGDGTVSDDLSACRTSIIPVTSGETYTLSIQTMIYSNSVVLLNDGTFVRREHKIVFSSIEEATITVTIPSGVNQIYAQFYDMGIMSEAIIRNVKPQLEKGNVATSYTPYSESNAQLTRAKADLEASNYLGWTTPTELIEQGLYNYVSGDVCHQRVGRVDATKLAWRHQLLNDKHTFYAVLSNGILAKPNIVNKAYIRGYKAVSYGYMYESTDVNEQSMYGDGNLSYVQISTATSNLSDFVASLSGKYLYYELATEQTATTQLFDEIVANKKIIRSIDGDVALTTNEVYKISNLIVGLLTFTVSNNINNGKLLFSLPDDLQFRTRYVPHTIFISSNDNIITNGCISTYDGHLRYYGDGLPSGQYSINVNALV